MSQRNVNYTKVAENLKKVIGELDMNSKTFAELLNYDPSNFNKKLKGDKAFTRKDIERFKEINISEDFLETGEGALFTGPVRNAKTEVTKRVPVYDEEFGCGFLEFGDAAVRPKGYAEMPGTSGATCWCKATGDSMSPIISNGDYVCLKRLDDWKDFIVYGENYAIDACNDMRTIKKLERGENDEEFLLVPINKTYSSQPIKKSLIRRLFMVLAVTKIL